MGKKKHAEEHENLERWLVSYADFITLLFATFVVLYALSQSDIASFEQLQDSINKAFSKPSLLQGGESIMQKSNSDNVIGKGAMPDSTSFIPPALEFLSQKYEQESFEQIKDEVETLKKQGKLKGVNINISDRGLEITLADLRLFFNSGSAQLKKESHDAIKQIAELIKSKFSHHRLRVEGHSDNIPVKSDMFPSNWELSSARASSVVRFMISKFGLQRDLFAAVGYADTKPYASNKTEEGRLQNRRVSIIVLKNAYKNSEPKNVHGKIAELSEKNNIDTKEAPTSAAQQLAKKAGVDLKNVIVVKDLYEKENAELLKELKANENKVKQRLGESTVVVTNGSSDKSDESRNDSVATGSKAEQPEPLPYKEEVNIDASELIENQNVVTDRVFSKHLRENNISPKKSSENDILTDLLKDISDPNAVIENAVLNK